MRHKWYVDFRSSQSLSAGNASASSEENRFLRDLRRTGRASAGVATGRRDLSLPSFSRRSRLASTPTNHQNRDIIKYQVNIIKSQLQYQRRKYTETPVGAKA